MEGLLLGAAVLVCPVGMGLMMWFMAKGMRRGDAADAPPPSLEVMRSEHEKLTGEIERLERDRGAPAGGGRP